MFGKIVRNMFAGVLPLLTASALVLASCSGDPDGGDALPSGGPGLPLGVRVGIAGPGATRTVTDLSATGADAFYGLYPYPRTGFSQSDAVGVVHVSVKGGVRKALNYRLETSDGGQTWSVFDPQGVPSELRCPNGCDNYYFAYSPYKEGGLSESSDFIPLGTLTPETTAAEFFAPLRDAVLASHADQHSAADFEACDLLGAKASVVSDKSGKRAVADFTLDHQMALDIIALKKWDGRVTLYGAYDTWVAPNDDVWRMKQRLQPTVKVEEEPGSFEPWPRVSSASGFEGLGGWYHAAGAGGDTCRFYLQLVMPGVARSSYGYAASARSGGWLVDLPAVPAGQYVLVSPAYYRYFRRRGFTPSKDNAAGAAWQSERSAFPGVLKSPFEWTHEEVLFPDVFGRFEYHDVLQQGDQLLADGNISRYGTGIGEVRWIAYAPQPWLATPGFYSNFSRFNKYYLDTERVHDNGYRPLGREATSGSGIRYISVDYAAYGCSSLDDFWRTEICSHFLVFSNATVTHSHAVTHNDEIFSVKLPSISLNAQGYIGQLYANPSRWVYMSSEWQRNADGTSGIRSSQEAVDIPAGERTVNGSRWMIPTVAQYYVGLHNAYDDRNFLTSNCLPMTVADDREGIVVLREGIGFRFDDEMDEVLRYVYFGNGHAEGMLYNNSFETAKYSMLPIAYKDIASTPVLHDALYLYNEESVTGVVSPNVIIPPDYYRACIIF